MSFSKFRWRRRIADSHNNYEWVEGAPLNRQFHDFYFVLLETKPCFLTVVGNSMDNFYHKPEAYEHYYPLQEHPNLFQTLARLEPTQKAILSFANTYGVLGGRSMDIEVPREGGRVEQRTGEPLDYWQDEILDLRFLYNVWIALNKQDIESLSSLGELIGNVFWRRDEYMPWYSSTDSTDSLPRVHKPSERVTWIEMSKGAREHLCQEVSRRLEKWVSPKLQASEDATADLLLFAPSNLIGAIWLQFAQAINGAKNWKQCPGCNMFFEVAKWATRSDRKTCSVKCRQRLSRKNKKCK